MRAFWLVILVMVLGVGAYALVGNGGGTSKVPPAPAGTATPQAPAPAANPTPSALASRPEQPAELAGSSTGAKPSLTPEAQDTRATSPTTTQAGESSIESLRQQRTVTMMSIQSLRDQATQVELSIERMPDRAEVLTARLQELRDQLRVLEAQADGFAAQIAALAAALPEVQASTSASPGEPARTEAAAGDSPDASTTEANADGATTEASPADLALFAVPARIAGFEVTPAKIETREQGGVLVDTRFVIKGSGTASDPFVVPWEMLTSAEEGFAPQAGRKQIPQRVAMLDGKYVAIKGYVAFPLAMDEPRELLAMLNQWDGCCIGVPPTPYDAIEVQLKAGAKGDDRFAISGEVAGRFSVKPYVVGDWLVGMYVMENAEFKARGAPGT